MGQIYSGDSTVRWVSFKPALTTRAIGLHCQPHAGDIDGKEGTFVLAGEHTAGLNGLSRPAIKAKDAVGLRDGVPALEITELAAISDAAANVPLIGLTT